MFQSGVRHDLKTMSPKHRLPFLIRQKKEELSGVRWLMWLAVLGGALSYTEAAETDAETLYEAIAAIEKYAELQKAAAKARN